MKMIRVVAGNDKPTVVNADKIIFFGPGDIQDTTVIVLEGDCQITAKMSFGQLQSLLQETPTYGVWGNGKPKKSLGDDGQLPGFGNPNREPGTVANNERTFGLQHG